MSSSPEPLPGSASSQTEQEKRIAETWQSYTKWFREPMLKECNFGGDIVDSIQTEKIKAYILWRMICSRRTVRNGFHVYMKYEELKELVRDLRSYQIQHKLVDVDTPEYTYHDKALKDLIRLIIITCPLVLPKPPPPPRGTIKTVHIEIFDDEHGNFVRRIIPSPDSEKEDGSVDDDKDSIDGHDGGPTHMNTESFKKKIKATPHSPFDRDCPLDDMLDKVDQRKIKEKKEKESARAAAREAGPSGTRSQTAGPSSKKRAVDFVAELEKEYLAHLEEREKSAPQPRLKKQKKE